MLLYLIFAVVFLILFSLFGFWQATHPPRFITNLSPKDLGWEYKDVALTTEDSVKLAAWFVPSQQPSKEVVIMLHGYPADKANLLQWAGFLHKDFNLLFLDFRYFGESEGSLTTVGLREQKDLEAAMEYLQKKGFSKIGAMGFSLGGAVAIMVGAKDGSLRAIISDSAFASLDLMAKEYYKNLWILKHPLSFLTTFWSKVFLGVTPSEVSPERAAQSLQIPILLIHSRADPTIPFENAEKLQKALAENAKAEFLFLEKGIHGALPADLLEEYQKRVLEFFSNNLK